MAEAGLQSGGEGGVGDIELEAAADVDHAGLRLRLLADADDRVRRRNDRLEVDGIEDADKLRRAASRRELQPGRNLLLLLAARLGG